MKAYPKYKQTSITWAKEIPEHWEVVMNKYKFFIKKSVVGDNSSNYILLSLTLKGIIKRDMENPTGKFPAEFNSYQIVLPNDLVFCLFDVEETPRTIGISDYEGMITGAYTVVESKKDTYSKFLYYYYLFLDKGKSLKCLYTGLRNTISKDTFLSLISPFPPFKEQKIIAEYLDSKLIQIDTAIKKKKKLIALLKEQKQAIINKGVTKGIDSNVPLKPSGIEWLGEIPAHWEVKKLRHLGKLQNGISAGAEYFGEGYPFVNYSDVYKNMVLPLKVNGLAKSTHKERTHFSVKKGDVFFTRTSETIDEIGIASTCLQTIENATFAGFLIRFRPRTSFLDEKFSMYYFRNPLLQFFFGKQMNLVIRASLSQELLKKLPVLLPPIPEQQKIVKHIEAESSKIEKTIHRINKEIALLQEYKTALIAEAVTGKIDVRDCTGDFSRR